MRKIDFKTIADSVPVRDYAERIGMEIDRNGMVLCPFHGDRNPSMKVDSRYHCFACGADGDVIDFVSEYNKIPKTEAAERIVSEFGIDAGTKYVVNRKSQNAFSLRERKNIYMLYLISLEKELNRWLRDYKPKPGDEELHFLFSDALHRIEFVGYLIDILDNCRTDDEIKIFFDTEGGEILL